MAALAIASGAYEVVLVGGVEKMRTLTTDAVTDTLATASDQIYDASIGMTFPGLYATMATAHFAKYNSSWEELTDVAVKNHHNGALNKKAQYQEELLDLAKRQGERGGYNFSSVMEFLKSPLNPMVAYPLRLYDCCPISDGAATIILASEKAEKL